MPRAPISLRRRPLLHRSDSYGPRGSSHLAFYYRLQPPDADPEQQDTNWKRRLSAVPGLGGLAWLLVEREFDPFKYTSFTTNAGEQVHRLTQSVAGRVEARARSHPDRVLPPTLVIESNADATVATDAVVDRLLGRLDPHRHERCCSISTAARPSPSFYSWTRNRSPPAWSATAACPSP